MKNLSNWILENPSLIGCEVDEVRTEQEMTSNGFILFIPDIVCYNNGNVMAMVEVVYKHDLNDVKLWTMQHYFHYHNISPLVITVNAWMLMSLVETPKYLKYRIYNKPEYQYR